MDGIVEKPNIYTLTSALKKTLQLTQFPGD